MPLTFRFHPALRIFALAALICQPGGHARANVERSAYAAALLNADLPLAENDTPDVPVVLRVSRYVGAQRSRDKDPGLSRAERGDEIFVHVQDLEKWIALVKGDVPLGRTKIVDLVLYLNGSPLKGVHPDYFFAGDEQMTALVNDVEVLTKRHMHYLRFTLDVTEDSRATWQRLLSKPDFDPRSMEVSVGFDSGQVMQTYVAVNKREEFFIVTLPLVRFWEGVGAILVSLAFFLVLARDTAIIRDTTSCLRPDGSWPYSLARMQMAFWFFLVLTSFCFLYLLTGEMDTINSSVLALLGISAGTALGAAFAQAIADSNRPAPAGGGLAAVDLSKPPADIRRQLARMLAAASARLDALEKERAAIDEHDQASLDKNGTAIKDARDHVKTLRQQDEYFERPAWKGVLLDLLVENGFVSFHRFQILIWTLVLGVMFVAGVYSETAMPDFNSTLLGLLGISGGTYVGFKLAPGPKETA